MQLICHPIRRNNRPTLTRTGDVLVVNEQVFDFTDLPEGEKLQDVDIGSEWLLDVSRENNELRVNLLLAHGPDAPVETLFPDPIETAEDGPVPLPPYGAEAAE